MLKIITLYLGFAAVGYLDKFWYRTQLGQSTSWWMFNTRSTHFCRSIDTIVTTCIFFITVIIIMINIWLIFVLAITLHRTHTHIYIYEAYSHGYIRHTVFFFFFFFWSYGIPAWWRHVYSVTRLSCRARVNLKITSVSHLRSTKRRNTAHRIAKYLDGHLFEY